MQNSKYLAAALAVCLTLSGCANRETQQTASVSSTGGEQVSSSLPSSQSQQTQEPEQTPLPTAESADGSKEAELGAEASAFAVKSEGEGEKEQELMEQPLDSSGTEESNEQVDFIISYESSYLDEYGNLLIDRKNADTISVGWMPIPGYEKVDIEKTTDQASPGIQNEDGELILDYLRIVHTDGIDVIDYETSISPRMELFSQVVNSKKYKGFVSVYPNGGGAWVNKNAIIVEDVPPYYGYLLDCTMKLTENHFLIFYYYFRADQRYFSYAEVPDEIKEEVLLLMDSFSFS